MSGDGQLRAFIERILRLKEEQDTLAADIREVYAEAKGSGFDKTAMGQLVAHLRKVEKVGVAAVEEGQTVFDLYLDAYRRATGTGVATHTHEASQSYAEVKGGEHKIIDKFDRAGNHITVTVDDRIAEILARGEITEHEQPETAEEMPAASGTDRRLSVAGPKDAVGRQSADTLRAERERPGEGVTAGETAPITNPPAPASQALADKTGEAGTPAVSPVAITDADVPAFLRKAHKPLRPHCLNPGLCAGSGRNHCHTCKKAMAESEAA